jgi:CheY-like chemotaxis protein
MTDNQFANRRILVVDDEERMVHFIRLNLEHDGFQVIEAFTGQQAMDRSRENLPIWYCSMSCSQIWMGLKSSA